MLDFIYQMSFKLFCYRVFFVENRQPFAKYLFMQSYNGRHYVTSPTL